jgi:cytochrome c6
VRTRTESECRIPKVNVMRKITALIALLVAGATATSAATVKENWDTSCASCHGEDGKGQTKQGKRLKLRDYTDAAVQASMKDEEMVKAILDGIVVEGKQRKKGFREDYSEAQAKELVAFIRTLKK